MPRAGALNEFILLLIKIRLHVSAAVSLYEADQMLQQWQGSYEPQEFWPLRLLPLLQQLQQELYTSAYCRA